MHVFHREGLEDDESVAESVTSADMNDVFGVEEGGIHCFTNSIVIIYLRLCLNEQLGLTGFVSWHTPDKFQVDTMVAPAATATAKKQYTISSNRAMGRSTMDILADSINNLEKSRKSYDSNA